MPICPYNDLRWSFDIEVSVYLYPLTDLGFYHEFCIRGRQHLHLSKGQKDPTPVSALIKKGLQPPTEL